MKFVNDLEWQNKVNIEDYYWKSYIELCYIKNRFCK